jgi:hypothetical protein
LVHAMDPHHLDKSTLKTKNSVMSRSKRLSLPEATSRLLSVWLTQLLLRKELPQFSMK